MIDRLVRYGSVVLLAALLGCAMPGAAGKEVPEHCPACKVRVTKRASLRGRVPAHTYVKYLCPSCGKGWEGEAAAGSRAVCPKCKRTLNECPACCKKGATNPHREG
jgi:hypothetical protein